MSDDRNLYFDFTANTTTGIRTISGIVTYLGNGGVSQVPFLFKQLAQVANTKISVPSSYLSSVGGIAVITISSNVTLNTYAYEGVSITGKYFNPTSNQLINVSIGGSNVGYLNSRTLQIYDFNGGYNYCSVYQNGLPIQTSKLTEKLVFSNQAASLDLIYMKSNYTNYSLTVPSWLTCSQYGDNIYCYTNSINGTGSALSGNVLINNFGTVFTVPAIQLNAKPTLTVDKKAINVGSNGGTFRVLINAESKFSAFTNSNVISLISSDLASNTGSNNSRIEADENFIDIVIPAFTTEGSYIVNIMDNAQNSAEVTVNVLNSVYASAADAGVSEVILGVNDEVKAQSIYKVYPNPAESILNLDGFENKVTIFNLVGVIVYEGLDSQISVADWNAGVYFVKSGTKVIRFIKK